MCHLPKYVDWIDVSALTMLVVDDAEVGVVDKHARFSVYCEKPEALNVVAVSAIFVCTTQTYTDRSTAMHVDVSMHSLRQADIDLYG